MGEPAPLTAEPEDWGPIREGGLARWAAALGMREGQLWTAVIGLAVAAVLAVVGIPATVQPGHSTPAPTHSQPASGAGR